MDSTKQCRFNRRDVYTEIVHIRAQLARPETLGPWIRDELRNRLDRLQAIAVKLDYNLFGIMPGSDE